VQHFNSQGQFSLTALADVNRQVIIIIIIINLLAQKQDRVTRATKQSEQDSKDTDATNSCPRNVQVKTIM